jgi:hypothetical protein
MEVMMSFHSFIGKDGHWEIIVGWDDTVGGFYAVVEDVDRYDDAPVFSAGLDDEPIDSVEELAVEISPYGEIPDDLLSMLRDDKAGLTPLTPL